MFGTPSLFPVAAPRSRAMHVVVAVVVAVVVLTNFTDYAPLRQWLGHPAVAYVSIVLATYAVGRTLYVLATVRVVVPQLPQSRMAGITSVMETVAGYVLGVLIVGIILGVFILISSMQFNINGTRYTLIPQQLSALAQSTTMTLISIIIIVAIVIILIPVVRYLLDLFGRGGGR